MLKLPSLFASLVVAATIAPTSADAVHARSDEGGTIDCACKEIASEVSGASAVFFPGAAQYTLDVEHYAVSSSQNATCSVEPGTADDVGKILKIVGKYQTPFAVKGGGHAMNPGFSSTPGIQISMTRFNETIYSANSSTAEVGMGLIWDEVYAELEKDGVTVVGGRVSGIGVAGFSMGGGYSWLTNQHGLTIDNIVKYELVLPNGTVQAVTTDNSDLFFALKGGYNNFGIVTRITLKTFSQGQVWAGNLFYSADQIDAVMNATSNFSVNNTDPKAQLIASLNFLNNGTNLASVQMFYDAPEQPIGIFDELLAIPSLSNTASTKSLLSFVNETQNAVGLRGRYNTVSLAQLTPAVVNAMVNDYQNRSAVLSKIPQVFSLVSYDLEPFLGTIFSFNTTPTAYPPDRSRALLPFNLYFGWSTPDGDDAFVQGIDDAAKAIEAAANADGQNVGDAALYPNYALADTPIERMYGSNLPRLKEIKALYDPDNVMTLAGGWKV